MIKITLIICVVMKVLQIQALVQLRTSLASSDNPLLAKILQSIDAATSDEHLFEVTLKLLKSLCVCMRDTLKAKEDTYNSAKNLIGLSKTVSTEGKVLDLYKKIYNNTCFNLKHDLSKRSNTSSESWSHSNCGKEDRLKENNTPKNEEDSQTVKNVLRSKLEHILYRALVQTRHHHKYNIKKYNLFGKAKSRVKSSLKHTLIVILTLHPARKDLRKYNVIEENLHKVLHKNSTIDIDIIDTKYDQKGKESEEAVKPEVYSDCHLQSLYTYLAESEKKNLTKAFRFLRRRDTIKIYIEVFTGRNHSDYINICCTNGSISTLCKKELIEYIDSQENITVQYKTLDKEKSLALKNNLKNTISKLKQLVKRLDFQTFNNSTIDLNMRNVDISNNIMSTNETNNDLLAMKENNSVPLQLGLKPNGLPNFVENLTHPLKLQDVSRAIILLNDFVSKQTTTDDIKSPGTNQADHKQVDLMNTLSLTNVPFTKLSPKTTSNLALLEESATISGHEIETSQDTIQTMSVKKQDSLNFIKKLALKLNDTELPSLPINFKIETHNTSTIPHNQVTTKSPAPNIVLTNLDSNITTSDINTKMVPINKLQHKLPSFRTLKDIYPERSTIIYDVNLTNKRYTKQFSSGNNWHDSQHISKNYNNIFSKNQAEITRENDKDTTSSKFEAKISPAIDHKSKYTILPKLKIRNDTGKPLSISISKRPENVSNVNFAHEQQGSKQETTTTTTQHKDRISNKPKKQYYLEQSTKPVNNAKTFQKHIVTSQVAEKIFNNSSISANSFGPKTTTSKPFNILYPHSKTTLIGKLTPHHKQNLQNQNVINYSNTLSKDGKQKNNSVSTRSNFTSTSESLKTFLTLKNVFKIKAANTLTEKPIYSTKIPMTQVSKEKQMKLTTKDYTSLIGIDQKLPLKNNHSNVNSDSLISLHLGAVANRSSYKHLPTHTWLSMTTNKSYNLKVLNATSRIIVNTYDDHKKVSKELQNPVISNMISEIKNTVTSTNKQQEVSNKTTRKINDIFENTISESYPVADSLVSDLILSNDIRGEPVTEVSIKSTMPFIKSARISTKHISSDGNKYFKYENVTDKIASILNPTAITNDQTETVKIKDSKTETIIPNVEWNLKSVTTAAYYDSTKTFKEPSSFLYRDKNNELNLSNMINNTDVDIKTLSSTTTLYSNPLNNRNKVIIGKLSNLKTSSKNHETDISTNNSPMLQITKSDLQNIYSHAESSISESINNTNSSIKSRTDNIDDDKIITNKQKLNETPTTSTTKLVKDTNTSTPKVYTINYRDNDPIENTINFIETFEDQIELNIPNDKNNTTESYKPKNIETNTIATILTRTTKDQKYSTRLRNETERDKSSIYNIENVTDEKTIGNLSVLSINSFKKFTTPMKFTPSNTKNVIYQEPFMLTEATSFSTSPLTHKYNQSSTKPLDKIENTSDPKNRITDMVKDKNVSQKHNIETSNKSEKFSLLNTKAPISVKLYDEMVESVFDTTAKELYDLEKTGNTEFDSISDQDDKSEYVTKPLLAKNDENSKLYTTIDPEISQYNYIKTYENAGKKTVSEIMFKQPYDFELTVNVVSQTSTEIINNTIENNISRSKLTILPSKSTLPLYNIDLIPKSTLKNVKVNINDTISMFNGIIYSTDTISSTIWSTTKNYESNTINIDTAVTQRTNMSTNPTETDKTVPFDKPPKFLNTENIELDNSSHAVYDEIFATNADDTVEILDKGKNVVSSVDLTITLTFPQQNTKILSNNTSKNTKDTIATESYSGISDTRNFNITNTTRSITKKYENDVSTMRYIDHVDKIIINRNMVPQTMEVITKNTSFEKTYKFLGTQQTHLDKTSDKIYDQMFNNSMKSKKKYTSATWNTTKNLKNEVDNITDLVLVKKGTATSINSTGIGHNTTQTLENITKNTFKRPYDFLGTKNIELDYISDPINNEQKTKEATKSVENISKTTKSLINPYIQTTSYSGNTLKYSPTNIRNIIFTELYKVTLEPRNINIPSTKWNVTRQYESHVNTTLKKDAGTEIRNKSSQANETRNIDVQKVKAFLKYTSAITKKFTQTQPYNISGNVNIIFSNESDGLNLKIKKSTTKAIGSAVNGGKITINIFLPQSNVKETSYSTFKHNSNTIVDKLLTDSYNSILESKNDYMSTTKKYTNSEINTKNIRNETTMKYKSIKSTKTQYNGIHKFESIVTKTSPMTKSAIYEDIFHNKFDPIQNKVFIIDSSNKKKHVPIENSDKIEDSTTDPMFPKRKTKSTSCSREDTFNLKNIRNKTLTVSDNTTLNPNISNRFDATQTITKTFETKIENTAMKTSKIQNIFTQKQESIIKPITRSSKVKTTKPQNDETREFKDTIKYTPVLTRGTANEHTLRSTFDPIQNKIFVTNYHYVKDIGENKNNTKITDLTTNPMFPSRNSNLKNIHENIITESYYAISELTNDNNSIKAQKSNEKNEDSVINKETINIESKMKDTLMKTIDRQNNETQKYDRVIKYTSPMTRSTTYKYVFHNSPERVHKKLLGKIIDVTDNKNKIKDLTTNPILKSNLTTTTYNTLNYTPYNMKGNMFPELYNYITKHTNVKVSGTMEKTTKSYRYDDKSIEAIDNNIYNITVGLINATGTQTNATKSGENIITHNLAIVNNTTLKKFDNFLATINTKLCNRTESVSNVVFSTKSSNTKVLPNVTKNIASRNEITVLTTNPIFLPRNVEVTFNRTVKYDPQDMQYTTFTESYNAHVTNRDVPMLKNIGNHLPRNKTIVKLNNTEMYDNIVKVTKTQDTKLNLIAVPKKEHTPRSIIKYTNRTSSTVFLAHNTNTNLEDINKVADMKRKNPNENALDISKIQNKITNQADTHRNIVITLQSTTESTFISTSFEKPVTNIENILKPHNIKSTIDVNKIKDQQIIPTPNYLDSTLKFAQSNTKFIIFQNSYNETDNSKIKKISPRESSTKPNVVNAIDGTPTSTINAYSADSSNFHVTETVFGNILKSINNEKASTKPNTTKHSLNYITENTKNPTEASNVTNYTFLQNITMTTAGTTRYTQFMLNETWLSGTGSTIYTTEPELRKNKTSKIKNTFNNTLTTKEHKPYLKNIASKSNISWKSETTKKPQVPIYNFKSLTKAMSTKYLTSKPHTSVNTTFKIETKINKVITIKDTKSSHLKTIWPLYVTDSILPVLQTSGTDLLNINTTGLQEQVIQRKITSKPNNIITELNDITLEKSELNLKELQISERNTKKIEVSKEIPKLYLQSLSTPLDMNTDLTLKVGFHPILSNSTRHILKDIRTPEVSKIHGTYTKKLVTAATPFTVSVTKQSYYENFRPILGEKPTNNAIRNYTDKNIDISDFLYTKPIQTHKVLNTFISDYMTQSKLMNANDTIFTTKEPSSVISSNVKSETIKTFAKPTKTPIFKLGHLNPEKFPTTNDTIHSKSGNLKTIKPDEFELSIRVGIETTKDGIQFSLVGIDEKPTKISSRVDPKSTKKTPTKAFVLPLSTNRVKPNNVSVNDHNDDMDSKILTFMNLSRRANKRNDIAETITVFNNFKQTNPSKTTNSLGKKAVTVILNTQNKTISNNIANNTSDTDDGNKKNAVHSTVTGAEQITQIMNVSSTIQPIWRKHKKIVIKPSSLTDEFTRETLKQLYEKHLQQLENVTNEIKMTTQMNEPYKNVVSDTPAITRKDSTVIENEKEDSDSLFKENVNSEDDNSIFVPHHVPKTKIKSFYNVTKEHYVTHSTTNVLLSHDNITNRYQYITGTNTSTFYQDKENKAVPNLVIKDINLHNNSKLTVEDHDEIKYHNGTTAYNAEMENNLQNETTHTTPNQNKVNESIAKILNISVNKTSATEIKKRNKLHIRKRKKLINALKYKNDIVGLLKKLVKTKKLDIKELNSTNKNNVIHSLLSKIRKPTIHINKTYMQNKSINIPIETNYKRLSDGKLHEEYKTQIDKPTRKSYFSNSKYTGTKLNYPRLIPTDIITRMKNKNKMSFNRTFTMTSTIFITEVTNKPEQKIFNSSSFLDIKLDEISGVPNSTKSYKVLNQSLNNNLQNISVATFNHIEVKDKITKPDILVFTPIVLKKLPSNITNPLSLINTKIKGTDRSTEFTKNNPILDNDSKENMTTLTTTNIKTPTKTHYITIEINIPYLTLHETTKKTSKDHLSKTKVNNNEYTSEFQNLTAMFNMRSKDSIDPLTPAVRITNATKINLSSTVEPKTFRNSYGITHSLKMLSDFASKDRKPNVKYVQQISSTTNKAMNTFSYLELNELYVRRHVNEQNKSVTKHVINDIKSNKSNQSMIKFDIDNKLTEVDSAISNTNYSSITPNTSVLLNWSEIKKAKSNTAHISKNATSLNFTKPPKKHFYKSVSNEIIPGNNSELSQIKTIDKIIPGKTLEITNLFPIRTEIYTENLDTAITPVIVTKVINLGENNLKLDNSPVSEIRTRAHLYNKTPSDRLDLHLRHELNFTMPSILTTVLKEIQDYPKKSTKKYFSSSTSSENNLKLTATTDNPTIFNISSYINTDPLTTTVRFRTTDNSSFNIATTKRTSDNSTLKIISVNGTPNVHSTTEINLNQTTSLTKYPNTTRHEKLNSFESTYKDASNIPQDVKKYIITESSFTENTTSTTKQANIKSIYKEVTQNPTKIQVDAMTTVGKLDSIQTPFPQTEIMPTLLKIQNATKIYIDDKETEITTSFVKFPFNFLVENETVNREKSNVNDVQKTLQTISTRTIAENNHTSHFMTVPLNTVSINHIISKIYILDPITSNSIWNRYTKGNKRQNSKTTKIYQKTNKISESSTNKNPLSTSNNIKKLSKNTEDITVTMANHQSEMNTSNNEKIQNNKTLLTEMIRSNLKSYLSKITVPLLLNNSVHQKQLLNQFKIPHLQNKRNQNLSSTFNLDTTKSSSKSKISGLTDYVTIKFKDKNTKHTSKDDRFSPTLHKSTTEINISTRKANYNPLSTIFAESGSMEGKNVRIFSSRLNRYHFLRPPLTVTNHIKYNTYQPPTEGDIESLTFKPRLSPRPNVSCAILKTMRHKFHSTYEFMEFLKASNCSGDNLTIHFNIKNNRFLKPPLNQNPNKKINNNKHSLKKLTKKVFTKLGSKESLLNSFEKTKLYPIKPAKAVLPKFPLNIVKRINIGGPKKKEVISMNTRDFFSQHRLATPSHSKSQNIKVRQNNPLLVNTRFSIVRPKFNPLEMPRKILDRPKTFFLPPRNEEETFAEIYEAPLHHKKLNWKQRIGSVRAALKNNPAALFPSQIKSSVSNVLDKPHTHPKTDWDIFRDKTDLSNKKLWGPPDFVPVTWPPTYDLSLPKPLTPTADEYNLRQLQYRRNFQIVTPTLKDELLKPVTDWWLNDMYLKVRLPLPINSNPGMVFPRRHFAKMEEVADLGALFIDDILDYKEMLDRGELPLERANSREKGQPLCMEQFYRLLGVCRIPEVGRDQLELPAVKSETEEQEELVVVACRNYFYPIPVKAADRGRITPGEIQAQLLHAMVDAAGAPPAPRIGLLTSMNRDQWAKARKHLFDDAMNRMNLELISRALCILCLDEAGGDRADTDPETNAMLRAMHGAGTRHHSANRWFDKTVQLIISSDGTVGMCYEHSAAEGVAVVRLAERALARAEVADRPAPPPALLPTPQAMNWKIVPEVQSTIEHAARELDKAISDLDFKVYTYRGYGREFMKSCRTSPDVYIQLAIQYAYYKMYGYLVTTYESASLRRFRQGRVDNIRSAHGAALAWAAAMCTAEASPLNDGTDEGQKKVSFNLYGEQKKIELFEEAARKQTSIMEANILGKGIDNHLLGLREMARETLGELPPVFCDAAYKQMFEFKMSTSQVTTTTDGTFMGYGAVCPDGYGCCYNPKKDSIIFCISSFTSSSVTNTEAYRQSLEEALDSMKLMFQARKVDN